MARPWMRDQPNAIFSIKYWPTGNAHSSYQGAIKREAAAGAVIVEKRPSNDPRQGDRPTPVDPSRI